MRRPGTARPLPGRGNRPRISGEHRDIERADVDAELERVGRDDAAHQPLAQPALDLAPPQRQVAAAIAANQLGHAGHVLEILFQIGRQDLGREPALRKDDDLQSGGAGTRRRRAASRLRYDRRMPSSRLTTGGLTKTKNFSPRGAPLSATSANGRSASRSASSRGLAIVADEQMICGSEP